jgi:hypothetical protein
LQGVNQLVVCLGGPIIRLLRLDPYQDWGCD